MTRRRRLISRPVCLAVTLIACAALPAAASVLVVTNTTEVVNGDVSSPGALQINPGADGISLREAILAANNAVGPHDIVFSPTLAGQAIALASSLSLTRDDISITGLATPDGRPNLILDASRVANIVISLRASGFTLRLVHVTGIGAAGGGIGVRAGGNNPATVANLRIENNIFEGQGTVPNPNALSLGTDRQSSGAVLRNVWIVRNTFLRFPGEGDAVHVPADGANGSIENLTIERNTFSEVIFPIELVPTGVNNRIARTTIRNNSFVNDSQAITLGTIGNPGQSATGNTITDTVITSNVFAGNNLAVLILAGSEATASGNAVKGTIVSNNEISGSALNAAAGARGSSRNLVEGTIFSGNVVRNSSAAAIFITGGSDATATANAILDTTISNDLIVGTLQFAAIGIVGGGIENRVDGVRITNCTIAKNAAIGAPALGGGPGGTGSTVSGISVVNTIFWQNEGDVGLPGPNDVRFCITAQPGLLGVNGNVASDPKFVDAGGGDFHLLPGSPAIDAGTSDGAPSRDLEGRPRFDDPATPNSGAGSVVFYDIGAYEYASVPTYRLTVAMVGTGNGTVGANPSGIDCGSDCSALYYAGTVVTLTPAASPGSAFAGWVGDGTCGRITIAGDKTCTARFLPWRQPTQLPPRR